MGFWNRFRIGILNRRMERYVRMISYYHREVAKMNKFITDDELELARRLKDEQKEQHSERSN